MKNTTEFIRRFGPWLILAPQFSIPALPLMAAGIAVCAVSDICDKAKENQEKN